MQPTPLASGFVRLELASQPLLAQVCLSLLLIWSRMLTGDILSYLRPAAFTLPEPD